MYDYYGIKKNLKKAAIPIAASEDTSTCYQLSLKLLPDGCLLVLIRYGLYTEEEPGSHYVLKGIRFVSVRT